MTSSKKFYKVEQNNDIVEVEADTFSVDDQGMLFLKRKAENDEAADWSGMPPYVIAAVFPKGCWTGLIACYRDLQEEHKAPNTRLPVSM